jgi:hypothetical protein
MFKYICTIIFLSNCFYGYTADKKSRGYGKVKETLPHYMRFNEACKILGSLQKNAKQRQAIKKIKLAKKLIEEWEKKDLPNLDKQEAEVMLKKGWDMVFNPKMWHWLFDGSKECKDLIKLTLYLSEFSKLHIKAQRKDLPVPYKYIALQNMREYKAQRLQELNPQGLEALKNASVL